MSEQVLPSSHHTLSQPLVFGPVRVYPGDKSGKYPDGNQVVVQGGDSRVAFDTPLSSRALMPVLQDADLLLLSHVHEDHVVALGQLLHVPVRVHDADLAALQSWSGLQRHYGYPEAVLARMRILLERDFGYVPRPDAQGYGDGAEWDLGGGVRVRAHHLPGHTAGHSALVVESHGVAFIGDIDLTGFGPYYGDATSDLQQFQHSLARVRDLDAAVWITSHHRGVITDRTEFRRQLARFEARISERSQELLDRLRDAPRTLEQLARRGLLYPPGLDLPFAPSAERRTILLHLRLLQRQELVREEAGGIWRVA